MRSRPPLSNTLLLGLMLSVAGCAASSPAADQDSCEAAGLGSAFAAGSGLSSTAAAGCDGEDCSVADARPAVTSEEEGACAVAGLKQGLSRGHGHGHGHARGHKHKHKHGHHGQQKQCRSDGRIVGQTAAALYCDLSIALGGLGEDELLFPGPASHCSRAFEAACHRAFDRAAADYAASIGDPAADCTVFTRGEFRAAYEVARHNQCLFSVGTEPPPPNECRHD